MINKVESSSQNQTSPQAENRAHTWLAPLVILVACGFLFFTGLNAYGLVESEGYFPVAAREMIEAGNFLVPRMNYQLNFAKPILTYWLTISTFSMFGVSEWASRIFPALFASGLVFVSYWSTRRIAGTRAALLSALMLASSELLLSSTRRSAIDGILAGCLGTAFCATLAVLFGNASRWWPLIYVALGLSVLAKGPAGLFLYGLGFPLFLALRRAPLQMMLGWMRQLRLLPGISLFLAIVLPWYWWIGAATNGLFLKVFIIYENFGRFAGQTNAKPPHWWLYLAVLPYGFFPYSLYLPAALRDALKPWLRRNVTDTEAISEADIGLRDASLFAVSCALMIVLFFSASKTQLDTYVLPAWPLLAFLTGTTVDRSIRAVEAGGKSALLKITSPIFAAVGVILVGVSIAASIMLKGLLPWEQIVLPIAAAVAAVPMVAQYFWQKKGQVFKSVCGVIAGTCIALTAFLPIYFETFYRNVYADADKLAASLENSPGDVAQFHEFWVSLLFYRKGPIEYFWSPGQIILPESASADTLSNAHHPVYVIVHKNYGPELLNGSRAHFALQSQRGDWQLYRSDDGVLKKSATLAKFFEWYGDNSLLNVKSKFGSMAIPYGGGSYPKRLTDLSK